MAKPDRPYIPEQLEDLTPDWLTSTLRERGLLDGSTVTAVEREILGDGEGFLGVIARLSLELDRDAADTPRSIVAKLPLAANRVFGEVLGAYEREIMFYQELAPLVPLRTPRVFYGALDRDRGSESQAAFLKVFDRVPASMNKLLMGFGLWVAARKQRRYLLLMEDLSGARMADQIQPSPPDECRRILEAIARAHSAFWSDPRLEGRFWLIPHDIDARMRFAMFKRARSEFAERYPRLMKEGLSTAVDWLSQAGVGVARAMCRAPETLLHCDLRLDNVFFDDTAGEVVIIDWQLVRRGPAAYDVAYLLSGALAPDTPPETERDLLRAYHDALVKGGVQDYSFEQLVTDYQRGLLLVLQTLSTTGQVDMGDSRGVQLMDLWIERLAARVRGVDLAGLL